MQLSEFDFVLPEDRIALYPLENRDQSKLMRLDRTSGEISHHLFADLPDLLNPSDLLVLNNTKVIPARLLGHRLGLTSGHRGKKSPLRSRIEVLLVKPMGDDLWEVLVRPGRKMRPGERVCFGNGELQCEIVDRGVFGLRTVRFKYEGEFETLLDRLGHVPLPPYIARPDEPQDRQHYQTVFAKKRGAVAAPTAGLHFTSGVFEKLRQRGIEWREITLHVGLGTFQPIHSESIEKHHMQKECYEIPAEVAGAINSAKAEGRRIIAVGTTTTRALESAARLQDGQIAPSQGETDLFIYPGFRFRSIDGLITNFHLPRSTLLLLVSTLAGRERLLNAYQQAIQANYRFYSYGDCMLIL